MTRPVPDLGQCQWQDAACINPATKYDQLCNSHRRQRREHNMYARQVAITREIYSDCVALLTETDDSIDYKALANTAADRLWNAARKVTYQNYVWCWSAERTAKNLVKHLFCLAVARHRDPDAPISEHTCDKEALRHKIKLSYLKDYMPYQSILTMHKINPRAAWTYVLDAAKPQQEAAV